MKRLLGLFFFVFLGVFFITQKAEALTYDFSWTSLASATSTPVSWKSFGASSDKSIMLLASEEGRLYISENSGVEWRETQPAGDMTKNWSFVSVNDDGLNMLAGITNGRLYFSANGGNDWNEVRPAGDVDKNWVAGVVNRDSILVGVGGGRLYISLDKDDRSIWSEVQPAGDVSKNWQFLLFSNNGMVAGEAPGRVYLAQDNTGENWSEVQPAGDVNKNWVNGYYDGLGFFLLENNGRAYQYSNDQWQQITPLGNIDNSWSAVAQDSNGWVLIGDVTGRVFISYDYCQNWSEITQNNFSNIKYVNFYGDQENLLVLDRAAILNKAHYTLIVPTIIFNLTATSTSLVNVKANNSPIFLGQTVATSSSNIFKLAHGTVQVNNKIYLGTRTSPAKIVVFNNPDDLTDYQAVTTTGYDDIEVMIYDSTNHRLYAMLYDGNDRNEWKILSINPDNIADYSLVFDSRALNFGGGGPIATDGQFLYGATAGSPVEIYKIRLSDWSLVKSTVWPNTNQAHAAQIHVYNDRCELYITTAFGLHSRFAKVNCEDLTYTDVALEKYAATDDFSFRYINEAGGEAYVGVELSNDLFVIDTASMQVKRYYGLKSYGIFGDGNNLYNMNYSQRSVTIYPDFDLDSPRIYEFPSDTPNEFFYSTNGKKFFTHWNSDVGYLSSFATSTALYATSTVSLAWEGNVADGIFDIDISEDGVNYSDYIALTAVNGLGSLTNSNLIANKQYWFRITNINGELSSDPYVYTTTTPTYVAVALSSVPSVTTSSVSANGITINWSGNSAEYFIKRGSSTFSSQSSDWITSTNYTFTNLTCGTEYSFYLKGRNGDGVETDYQQFFLSTSSCSHGGGGSSAGGGNGGVVSVQPSQRQVVVQEINQNTEVKVGEIDSQGVKIITNVNNQNKFIAPESGKGWGNSEHIYKISGSNLIERTVTLVFYSDPVVVTLKQSEKKKIDLDLDGVFDLEAELVKLDAERPEIFFKSLKNSVVNTTKIVISAFPKDLFLGSRAKEVKQLQVFLNKLGFKVASVGLGSAGKETSYFGQQTKAALIKFQKAKKILPANGKLSGKTRTVINEIISR